LLSHIIIEWDIDIKVFLMNLYHPTFLRNEILFNTCFLTKFCQIENQK